MSTRCTICRNPQRESIDVSLLQDGTRSTARQYCVSRPALDRHKRHVGKGVGGACESIKLSAAVKEAAPSNLRLEALIRHCEAAVSQAQADKNLPGLLRALKELRAYLELTAKFEEEALKNEGRATDTDPQKPQKQSPPASEEEISLRALNNLYWFTKGFHPLKIWQLKNMFQSLSRLAQAKLDAREIAEQMTLRDVGGTPGVDVSFAERVFGILRHEEWKGQEEEVARSIAETLRNDLKGYPSILRQLDLALIRSISEPPARRTIESGG